MFEYNFHIFVEKTSNILYKPSNCWEICYVKIGKEKNALKI